MKFEYHENGEEIFQNIKYLRQKRSLGLFMTIATLNRHIKSIGPSSSFPCLGWERCLTN